MRHTDFVEMTAPLWLGMLLQLKLRASSRVCSTPKKQCTNKCLDSSLASGGYMTLVPTCAR